MESKSKRRRNGFRRPEDISQSTAVASTNFHLNWREWTNGIDAGPAGEVRVFILDIAAAEGRDTQCHSAASDWQSFDVDFF